MERDKIPAAWIGREVLLELRDALPDSYEPTCPHRWHELEDPDWRDVEPGESWL